MEAAMEPTQLKRVIEALLFVSDGPLTVSQIRETVEVAEADTAALPPAYPIGSAVLAGSVASAPPTPISNDAAVDEAKVCRSPVSGIVVRLIAF